jgi:hypothetical protein
MKKGINVRLCICLFLYKRNCVILYKEFSTLFISPYRAQRVNIYSSIHTNVRIVEIPPRHFSFFIFYFLFFIFFFFMRRHESRKTAEVRLSINCVKWDACRAVIGRLDALSDIFFHPFAPALTQHRQDRSM